MCEPCNSGKGKSQGKVREIQRTWVPRLGEVAEKVIFRLCGLDFSKIADLYGSHLFFLIKQPQERLRMLDQDLLSLEE